MTTAAPAMQTPPTHVCELVQAVQPVVAPLLLLLLADDAPPVVVEAVTTELPDDDP